MDLIPEPKSVINSKAFSIWCKAVHDYLDKQESNLIQRIADSQQAGYRQPAIIQTLAPKDFIYQLEEKWLFPMMDPRKFKEEGLLYVPLSDSQLHKLSLERHSYQIKDKKFDVKLTRCKDFIEPFEKKLSCHFGEEASAHWAKKTYLPELTFPFLPYSRKFVKLELLGSYTNTEKKLVIENFSPGNLILQDGTRGDDQGIVNNLIPVCNVRSGKLTVGHRVMGNNDGLYEWRPSANDLLYEGDTYIIHSAYDINGSPIKISCLDGKIVSDLKFHVLEYSIIKKIKNFPNILKRPIFGIDGTSTSDNFWYRIYLQTTPLTAKDIAQLLQIIPQTRGKLKIENIRMENITENCFLNFTGEDRPFFDYLWYLDAKEKTRKIGLGNMRSLSINFRRDNKIDDKDSDFLLEDLINYFTSICKLYLPMNFECRGFPMFDSYGGKKTLSREISKSHMIQNCRGLLTKLRGFFNRFTHMKLKEKLYHLLFVSMKMKSKVILGMSFIFIILMGVFTCDNVMHQQEQKKKVLTNVDVMHQQKQKKKMTKEIFENCDMVTKKLQELVMKGLEFHVIEGQGHMKQLQSVLEEIKNKKALEAVEVVYLCDSYGIIRCSKESSDIGRKTTSETTRRALKTGKLSKGQEIRRVVVPEGEKILYYAVPIPNNKKTCFKCHLNFKKLLGALVVGYKWDYIEKAW